METEKENKDQMMSAFAKTIMDQKYAHIKEDGTKESWEDIADRVVNNVMEVVDVDSSVKNKLKTAIKERKFIPGGRYLRCAGLPYHPINNCLLFRAEDSREGWADLMHKVSMSLMSGGGIGVVYSDIREKDAILTKTGGKASGPIPLMQIINEVGRGIMNAGERRCAIWSGLHWNHPDALEFTTSKDWSEDIRYMKQSDYNFPAKLDMTNISVILDDDFFAEYDKNNDKAHKVYWSAIRQMLQYSEPGFSVDVGKNKKENLRNAPVSGDTSITTETGIKKVIDIVGKEINVWTGKQWAKTVFRKTKENTPTLKVVFEEIYVEADGGVYALHNSITCDPDHGFIVLDEAVGIESRVSAKNLVIGQHLKFSHSIYYINKDLLSVVSVLAITEDSSQDVYCCDVGVEEHSFEAEGIIISNCTEITSEDDSDVCNLGSINMARVSSLEEMKELVELGVIFLLAGTEYSHFPTKKSEDTKNKNRRLGLGLMGIHEWLLSNGYSYSPCDELEEYLKIYSTSGDFADKWADTFSLSRPLKTRAIAPVGSIGIIGETTTGIEPLFCVAYKRRYFKEGKWFYQYVIDPTAKRLIDQGVSPDKIEDSYSLAQNVEKRVAFQAWIQQYVDHAISSTINLPAWGTEYNNESLVESFGNMLLKYLPKLRGITVYADGSRSGQPLNPVKYTTAIKHVGEIVEESGDVCDISGKGGSCGS